MKRMDLGSGMVVQYRNGELRMVVGEWLLGLHSVNSLNIYYDDLTSKTHKELDIVKVWKPMKRPLVSLLDVDENVDLTDDMLLYDEKDKVVEMTIEEIKEKLGIPNLKIVENEFEFQF